MYALTHVLFSVPRALDNRTQAYLHKLPFKHKPPVQKPQNPKTMAQMRERMDDKAWNKHMEELTLRMLQFERKPGRYMISWAKEYPELFYDVVQGYIAQQNYYGLELPPALKQWEQAQKDRRTPSTLAAPIDAILHNMGVERCGAAGPPVSNNPDEGQGSQ